MNKNLEIQSIKHLEINGITAWCAVKIINQTKNVMTESMANMKLWQPNNFRNLIRLLKHLELLN